MNTYISDFSVFVKYITETLENTTYALLDQHKISMDNFEYLVFDNYGEFIEEHNKAILDRDKTPILVCVRNENGSYDSSSNVDTYIQDIGLEIMAPLKYKEDVATVINSIAMANAKKLITLGEDSVDTLLLIEDLPVYGTEHDSYYSEEAFTVTLPMSFIIIGRILLSDSLKILVNDCELRVKSWSLINVDELEPDNKYGYGDNRARFLPNASSFVFKIDFFHQIGNVASDLLFSNALTNSNFGQIYNVKIKMDESVLAEYSLIHHQSTIVANSGSLITISTDFYPYSPVALYAESER